MSRPPASAIGLVNAAVTGNVVEDNTAIGNVNGIYLAAGVQRNLIRRNLVTGNPARGNRAGRFLLMPRQRSRATAVRLQQIRLVQLNARLSF